MEKKLQYAVLGLGIFGSTVSKTLSKYGCEVIAMDKDKDCVQRMADTVTQSICGDITDMNVLKNAGLQDCDVAVVATGSSLEDSILCLLHLKELGIPFVVAKAKNKTNREILLKIGADKVVTPEKEMGAIIAKGLLNKNILDVRDLDDGYSIMEIEIPNSWKNKTIIEVNPRKKYGINILAIRENNGKLNVSFASDYVFCEGIKLLVIGEFNSVYNLK